MPFFAAHQRLHLQFLRLEDGGGFPIGRDAIDARGRPGGCVDVARGIRGDRPDVSRRRGREGFERRSEFESALAAEGDPVGGAFDQIVEFRLFPGARAFGEERCGDAKIERVSADSRASVLRAKILPQ